jgi:osmoprotectant transport system ATP-binding protein
MTARQLDDHQSGDLTGDALGKSVTFEGVGKRFPDGTDAVVNLNLECPAGLITVFVGPSGCGKTTSLRMINQTVETTSGTIRLGGRDTAGMDVQQLRRGMGYVIQNAGLFPHRTIVQNIATIPVLTGTPKKQALNDALDLMRRVGLDPAMARRYPYQLSGGQQQRVGVARALAGDPPVLLMDEPFSAVDPVVRAELQSELLRLQREIHKTIIFVTHDIDEAVKLGDQIVVFMQGGKVAQVAPPEVILTEPANDFVSNFIGGDAGVKWMSLLSAGEVAVSREGLVTGAADPAQHWRLSVDEDGRVLGWIRPGARLGDADLVACRRTFDPERDHLRAVLDAILLSPCELAPAIDASGRVLGVAGYRAVAEAIRTHRISPF